MDRICGSFYSNSETFTTNFGTKITRGTLALTCDIVSSNLDRDYLQNSAFVLTSTVYTATDSLTTLSGSISVETNSVYIKSASFTQNSASLGHAVYSRGISNLTIDSSLIS